NHNNFYLLMKDVFIFILYEFLPDLISVSVLCEVKLICLTCLLLSYCQTVTNLHPEAPSLLRSHTHTHTHTHHTTHHTTHTYTQEEGRQVLSTQTSIFQQATLSHTHTRTHAHTHTHTRTHTQTHQGRQYLLQI